MLPLLPSPLPTTVDAWLATPVGTTALWLCALQAIVLLYDLFTYRIPNRIVLLLLASYPAYALFVDLSGWYWHLLIGLAALLVGYGLFALKVFGGGDAKWLAACCLWTGPAATLPFLTTTALLGGLFTLLILLLRFLARMLISQREKLPILLRPFAPVPYGVAIGLAFIWQLVP